jgi:hypothetical protein
MVRKLSLEGLVHHKQSSLRYSMILLHVSDVLSCISRDHCTCR